MESPTPTKNRRGFAAHFGAVASDTILNEGLYSRVAFLNDELFLKGTDPSFRRATPQCNLSFKMAAESTLLLGGEM